MEKSALHLLRRSGLPLLTIAASYLLLAPSPAFAASTIYLSPASKTVSPGTTFSVQIRENSGSDAVNAVEAHLSYPADKIDYLSYSGGSAFPIEAPSSGGGGNVSISRGVIGGGVTGDNLIASVSFRVRAGVTGGISISVTSGSLVRGSDQANVLGGKSGASYNSIIPTPVPTKKPTPTPTPPPSTPPAISKISVTSVSYTSATVTWTTDRPSSSIVNYGLNTKYGLSNSSDGQTTDHKVVLDSALLTPGTSYHYQIKSIDQWGNQATSKDAVFQTTGYTVNLTILDDSGSPLANTTITLAGPSGNKKATTDTQGKVSFQNLAPGTQSVVADAPGAHASTVTVTDQPKQSYQVEIAGINSTSSSTLSSSMLALLLALCIVLPLLVFAFIRLLQWLKSRRTPPDSPNSPTPLSSSGPESSSSMANTLPDPAAPAPTTADMTTTPMEPADEEKPLASESAPHNEFLATPAVPFDPTEHEVPAGLPVKPDDQYNDEPAHNQHEQIEALDRHMEDNL